jgi:hypothetical protein
VAITVSVANTSTGVPVGSIATTPAACPSTSIS